MTEMTHTPPARRGTGGPPPGVLAIISLVLTLAGILCLGVLSGGSALGSPFIDSGDLLERYAANTFATRIGALLQFGAAVPLGIFAATVYARQLRLGVRVPGPAIGFFGGIFASGLLAISALVTWVLSQPVVLVDAPTVAALSMVSFTLGGVGYAVGMGLLVAGIAVPAFILRLLPRWLSVVGLIIAGVSELSFLSLVFDPLQVLLPVARFGGGAWLIVAGFLLPARRRSGGGELVESEGRHDH